ncbi:MAG: hypothetical protein ACJAX9_000207 [Celeribacter sp.]|jgi:hypothetical protein
MSFNWTCPYCDRAQTVTEESYSRKSLAFSTIPSSEGLLGLAANLIVCSNPDCKKPAIKAHIVTAKKYNHEYYIDSDHDTLSTLDLMPQSSARPQPDCIPAALREDYTEACLIRDLSPKASATLSRRCLQGMIRDFCEIDKPNLFQEISALKKLIDEGNAPKGVSEDSVEALDAVRKIGNIGAHMEKDIDVIIDVEPEEAQVLIDLTESLFDEWYIEREKRKKRFAKIAEIADEKANQKLLSKAAPE